MNELVLSIITLLSSLQLPQQESPVARYHTFVAQAETAYFVEHNARKAIVLYDSAFAVYPGFRYDYLNAISAAIHDKHYRKFESFGSRGNAVGLNRRNVRKNWKKDQPQLWKQFKIQVKDIRVGYYGFFRFKPIKPSLMYNTAARKAHMYYKRDKRAHSNALYRALFAKGTHKRNLRRMDMLVAQFGFPDIRRIGDIYPCKDCAFKNMAVLDRQAQYPEFPETLSRFWTDLMVSLEKGGLYSRSVPYLIDQHLFYQGAPQLFGTLHVHRQMKDKCWMDYRHPVQDVYLANEWRKVFYLRPLETEIKMSGIGFLKSKPF